MATTRTKASYISLELQYMEEKIKLLKKAVDNILKNLADRYGPRELPNGKVVEALISTKEQQLKDATAVLEKLPKMLAALDELREKEEKKIATRGDKEISGHASKWLQDRE